MVPQNQKNLYRVRVTWIEEGFHDVEAWSPEKASEEALERGIPENAERVDDTMDISDIETLDRPVEVPIKETETRRGTGGF